MHTDTIQHIIRLEASLIKELRDAHRARVAALRRTCPMPGSIVHHGIWRGLVMAVTDNAVWMLQLSTSQLFKVA